eukprot:TRINITY_DN522_c0_g1_i3.p1 TRINITY_DN522_c0_g1~~TRINITY_DN522_c0_g1_i3.p1  ORF type:complete len:786 (+),score=150.20 TRINITY_DN522_c0_g1_i3:93-2360(+)
MVQSMGAISALRTGNVIFDMMIAMLIPLFFNFFIGFIQSCLAKIRTGDLSWNVMFGRMYERTIDHKMTQNLYGDSSNADRDTRNNVLLKAVQLYLDHKKTSFRFCRVSLISMTQSERPWYYGDDDGEQTPAGKLKKYRLAQKAPSNTWQSLGKYGGKLTETADKTGQEQARFGAANDDCAPSVVELRVEENEVDKGEKGEKTVSTMVYRFRSESAGAIDAFIEEAYQWYLGELRKMDDSSRYLYEMQLNQSSSGDGQSLRSYKRYKLSDEKSFASLFFDEKQGLLSILQHFSKKSGKYAIAGYPHKLGLLLHGPPGTGKTSLIKAMAHHTGRSIVNVPLARISTNQELMDIMFDQQYMVQGEEVPFKLGFKDVIFVMEDVDAASKVVHRRDGKTTSAVTRTEYIEPPKPKSPLEMLVQSTDDSCCEVVKLLLEKSTRLKDAAFSKTSLCDSVKSLAAPSALNVLLNGSEDEDVDANAMKKAVEEAKASLEMITERQTAADTFLSRHAKVLKKMLEGGAEVTPELEDELLGITSVSSGRVLLKRERSADCAVIQEEEEDEDGKMDMNLMMGTLASLMDSKPASGDAASGGGGGGGGGGMSSLLAPPASSKDKLNLSGLLNVLDGVVDTPERILIMTTNHPEQLDPALIRPGRVDKKILLGYMSPANATSMIEHYFQTVLDDGERARLRNAIHGDDAKGLAGLQLTPAQVEQLAAEHEEVEGLISELERKGGLVSAEPAAGPPSLGRTASAYVRYDH